MTKRIAAVLLALALAAPALAACGKKGPLDLPPQPTTKEQKAN